MEMLIQNETLNNGILAQVKADTFHYRASFGGADSFRVDGVYGSYIEFECFSSNGFTASIGDELSCSQRVYVDKDFVDTYPTYRDINPFPSFYVTSVLAGSNSLHIVAYDAISKLDVDYSKHLKSIEPNFPMALKDLFDDVVSFAGLTSNINWPLFYPTANRCTVEYFFVDGVTARQVISWITEIAGFVAFAKGQNEIGEAENYKSGNDIGNGSWDSAWKYIVCPGNLTYKTEDNTLTAINVQYKQNGLSIEKDIPKYDGLEILTTSYGLFDSYYQTTPTENIYYIKNNPLVDGLSISGTLDIAWVLYQRVNNIFATSLYGTRIVSGSIKLFSFKCPFYAGNKVFIAGSGVTRYKMPISSIDISDSGATLTSCYSEYVQDSQVQGTQINSLSKDFYDLKANPFKLVWENDNPTSTFSAQTVAIDLSAYSWVLVVATNNNTNGITGQHTLQLCEMDTNIPLTYIYNITTSGTAIRENFNVFPAARRNAALFHTLI